MAPAFASRPDGHWSFGRSVIAERHGQALLPWSTRSIDDQVLTYFFAPATIDHRLDAGATRTIAVPAGSTVLSMRGADETVRSRAPMNVLALSMPHAMLQRLSGSDAVEIEPTSGTSDPRLQRLMLLIDDERTLGFPAGSLFLDAACDALAAVLLSSRALPAPRRSALGKSRMETVRDAIADHLDDPMSLAALAGLIGVSTTTLTRDFRRHFGVTPHRFALEQRIERCKAMLRFSEQTVTEIALANGFQTPQHMATVFKRFTGSTPRTYRTSFG